MQILFMRANVDYSKMHKLFEFADVLLTLLQALWLIYGLTLFCRKNPTTGGYLYYSPLYMSPIMYIVMVLNFVLNISWLLVWDREKLWWGKDWNLTIENFKNNSVSVISLHNILSCRCSRAFSYRCYPVCCNWYINGCIEQKISHNDWRWY